MIDLHTHSTGSDGQFRPSELVKKAYESGINVLAITDHDSTSGIAEGAEAARRLDIDFIPGIEISCQYPGEMHMLGYFIDIESEAIQAACRRFVELRDVRAQKIIDYLQSKGCDIKLSDVKEKAGGRILGRPHFAQVLLEKGFVPDYRAAFDRYLATPEFDRIERPKPEPEVGIKIIHDGGGIAVLAHPMSLKLEMDALDRKVEELCSYGLDGIETYYGKHSKEQIEAYHRLAQKYHLIETAGSDFHGEKVKKDIQIGRRAGTGDVLVDEKKGAEIVWRLKEERND